MIKRNSSERTQGPMHLRSNGTLVIPLTQGLWGVIDVEDYQLIAGHSCSAIPAGKTHYIQLSGVGLLHQFLFSTNIEVDHEDRDGLNNSRSNFRAANRNQNLCNRGMFRNNTSGYKGVTRDGDHWRAQLRHQHRQHDLGRYSTPEEAALARDHAARRLHGPFAWLNFPDRNENPQPVTTRTTASPFLGVQKHDTQKKAPWKAVVQGKIIGFYWDPLLAAYSRDAYVLTHHIDSELNFPGCPVFSVLATWGHAGGLHSPASLEAPPPPEKRKPGRKRKEPGPDPYVQVSQLQGKGLNPEQIAARLGFSGKAVAAFLKKCRELDELDTPSLEFPI